MKKLSFLELEKEMEPLSREDALKTKGGHPPYDCFFQSLGYIINHQWGNNNITEQGIEDAFNEDMDPNKKDNYVSDLADDGVTIPEGQGWGNHYMENHFNGGSVSWSSGTSGIPNSTNTGDNDQFMLVVPGGNGMDHDVVFEHDNGDGTYHCWDQQAGKYVDVQSSAVEGSYDVHRDGGPSTTMPTTTIPQTTN